MDEWRMRLRGVVAGWRLPPEEHAALVEELEQHLDDELAELTPRIGASAALERIAAQVDDPTLRAASVPRRHTPAAGVGWSRERVPGWAALGRDIRYARRAFRKNPGTAVMAVFALAMGIALTTVMFTVIYGLLLRGLPFVHADRITMVMEANPSRGEPELSLSMHDFFAYRDAQRSFDTFGAWSPTSVNIADAERPERVLAARVTAAALSVPHVQPMLGRSLRAGDETPGGALVVVLSYSLWRDRYAGDSTIVGRAIRINGLPAAIVGVMPNGFAFPLETRIWIPLRLDPGRAPWGTGIHVNGVGRLRAGVTVAQANADLAGVAKRIELEHRDTNEGVLPVVQPFIRAVVPARVYALLYAMFGAVALVFLVACTNVANLLLARATLRSREVAVRVALGASRLAVVRQFIVEALFLSLAAAVLAALVAELGIRAFGTAIAGQAPFWADFRLHPQVFLFIAAAALTACVVSSLLPAVAAARSDINNVLKDQTLGSSSFRSGKLSRGLVVFELALSSALLVVAALVTRSVLNLREIAPGFRTAGVMTGNVVLSAPAAQTTILDRVETDAARLPGVVGVSLSSNLPGPGWFEGNAAAEGAVYPKAREFPSIRRLAVTPGFFKVFDVAITAGRPIRAEDRDGAVPVAVVNQRFVERFFPGVDPLGHRIDLTPDDTIRTWATIVGIMPNLYATDVGSVNRHTPWPAEVLTSFDQSARTSASIAIRTNRDPAALSRPLRTLVAGLDPDLPVNSLAPMSDVLAQSRWEVRVFGGLFVVFGIAALVLASIGLYAVLAFATARREREMGIRMALGARPAHVAWLVMRSAMIQLVVGMSIGLALGVAAARLAGALLFEVEPSDPRILAVVLMTLAITGVSACLPPAHRAMRADPVRSLRAE